MSKGFYMEIIFRIWWNCYNYFHLFSTERSMWSSNGMLWLNSIIFVCPSDTSVPSSVSQTSCAGIGQSLGTAASHDMAKVGNW